MLKGQEGRAREPHRAFSGLGLTKYKLLDTPELLQCPEFMLHKVLQGNDKGQNPMSFSSTYKPGQDLAFALES